MCVHVTEEDVSCAVDSCDEGSTLKSVGRHGRTECVEGVSVAQDTL